MKVDNYTIEYSTTFEQWIFKSLSQRRQSKREFLDEIAKIAQREVILDETHTRNHISH